MRAVPVSVERSRDCPAEITSLYPHPISAQDAWHAATSDWLAAFGGTADGAGPVSAPTTLKQVFDAALSLANAAGRLHEGMRLVGTMELRLAELTQQLGWDRRSGTLRGAEAPRVAIVSRLDDDSVVLSGRWIPDLAEAAGARAVGPMSGGNDERIDRRQLLGLGPRAIVIALEGRPLTEGVDACRAFRASMSSGEPWGPPRPALAALDGTRFVNSPGPSLVRAVELIALAVHGAMSGVKPAPDELELCDSSDSTAPGAHRRT